MSRGLGDVYKRQVLGELLKPKEIMGCVLVFAAVILAQVPGMKKGDTK